MQTRCIVKGEAQKSPLFWRFSGGFWFSQDRLFSRNSTRKPLNLIESSIFTNAPCKTTCLYNAPSMHTVHISCLKQEFARKRRPSCRQKFPRSSTQLHAVFPAVPRSSTQFSPQFPAVFPAAPRNYPQRFFQRRCLSLRKLKMHRFPISGLLLLENPQFARGQIGPFRAQVPLFCSVSFEGRQKILWGGLHPLEWLWSVNL